MTLPPVTVPPWTPADYGRDLGTVEQAYGHMYGRQRGRGTAVAAMVLGIIAIVVFAAPVLSYAAVVLALLATGLGIAGVRRAAGRGMAITGLVLGPLALIGAIVASVYWTGVFADAIQVAQDCADRYPGYGRAYERCVNEGGVSDPSSSSGRGQPA